MATAVSVDNEKRSDPKTEGPAVRTVLDHQTILSYGYVLKYDNVTANTLIAPYRIEPNISSLPIFLETPEDYKASPSLRPVALFRLSATARKQQRRQQ